MITLAYLPGTPLAHRHQPIHMNLKTTLSVSTIWAASVSHLPHPLSQFTRTRIHEPIAPMKKFPRLAVALLAAASVVSTAGDVSVQDAADTLEAVRSVIQADRQAVVAEAMHFSEAEAQAFWPPYHQYRSEMNRVGDGIKELILEYGQLYPEVPDNRAKRMLKDLLDLEKEQLATRASFLKKLVKIVPPAKALRFAQVESRLDLAVRAELAAHIDLVPIEGAIGGQETGGVLYQEGTAGGVAVRTRKISALVAAIDTANRKVVLVDDAGIKETVKIGPEAINFDQIRRGDRLEVVATEELVVSLAKPGDATDTGAMALVDLAPKGAKPGGVVAAVTRVTGTVTALDPDKHIATLRFADGSIRTLPVRSDVDLGQRKVGDQVVFQVTEMVALSVNKP